MSVLPERLDLASVPGLMSRADALAAGGTLDLSGVREVDSAGVAFLVELQRRAQRQQRTLAFTGAGEGLRRLAAFFELDTLLKLA
ncbi:STAS domain-containing protein [Solimonas fluminis]|nr:STAS domain-containing protein [Solimonas fluminis]